jgi:hypothetical protein
MLVSPPLTSGLGSVGASPRLQSKDFDWSKTGLTSSPDNSSSSLMSLTNSLSNLPQTSISRNLFKPTGVLSLR